MTLERRLLGPAAHAYLKQRLDAGRTLSKLLAQIDLSQGTVWAFASPDITDEALYRFDSGGIAPRSTERYSVEAGSPPRGYILEPISTPSQDLVVRLIGDLLAAAPETCCIFEHLLAEPNDRWLKPATAPRVIFDDDVYFYADHKHVSPSGVERAMDAAMTHWLAGCVAAVPDHDRFMHPENQLAVQDLQLLAESVRLIVISAYDGEGFLIWQPSSV